MHDYLQPERHQSARWHRFDLASFLRSERNQRESVRGNSGEQRAMNIRNCTGTHGRKHLQRGFALVTGVFLITMLFLLSAYMIGFRVQQDASISLDTLGTRAYAAARSGAELGAYNSLRPGPRALGNTTTSLALGGTLS